MKLILEFCQNHNGNEKVLNEMLERAARLGVYAVKLQCAFAEDLAFRPLFETGFESSAWRIKKRPFKAEYERIKKLELNFDQMSTFVKVAKSYQLEPIITAFNYKHLQALVNCGFTTVKIASYDCASYELVRRCSEKFANIIVSTGASYDFEIERCRDILRDKGREVVFLHCVSLYPTPLELANLSRIHWLRRRADEVGYSDHSAAGGKDVNLLSKVALYLGATWIERHFTVLRVDETRDGPVSIGSTDVLDLIAFSKLSECDQLLALDTEFPSWRKALGVETRPLSAEELANREYYRGRFFNPSGAVNAVGNPVGIYNWECPV